MKRNAVFLFGFIIGVLFSGICASVFYLKKDKQHVVLQVDCDIEGVGVLKKGTVLKIDEGMSEGFTRYTLHLNLSDNESLTSLYPNDRHNLTVPYWLRPSESASNATDPNLR